MAQARGRIRRAIAVVLTGFGLAAAGCVHTGQHFPDGPVPAAPIAVPPPGAVPRELEKVTLPEYVIEPPDILRIEVGVIARAGTKERNAKGEEEELTTDQLRSLPLQPVWGDYTVRPDGTLYFGVYGTVQVAGYTMKQAAEAIRKSLAAQVKYKPETLVVILDVVAYNSKKYYVILDGGGYGERVFPIPIQGSETVLDALGNVYGLPAVASKRNIWVARRCPTPGLPEQILPVDWVGITQHGLTTTNYQVLPGDRIYVKAQRIITFDTTLSRILQPIERMFGVTLLGSSTVNQISGRGLGFNGNQ
jgi:polysaccharide export outer membrane protein